MDTLEYVDFIERIKMSHNRLNTELFISKAVMIHGSKYGYGSTMYVLSNLHVVVTCPTHGDFKITPNNHLRGKGCPACGAIRTRDSKFLTTEIFIERSDRIHNRKYDYSQTLYTGCKKQVTIKCPVHGFFNQKPTVHLNGGGCPKCGSESSAKARSLDEETFVTSAKQIHGDRFSYDNLNFVNASKKVSIKCKIHGTFLQSPTYHLKGEANCPVCRAISHSQKHRIPEDQVIQECRKKHKNRYDYSLTRYTGGKNQITVICPEHGEFSISASNHMRGHGCKMCSIERLRLEKLSTLEDYIKKARVVHGDRYDYSGAVYLGVHEKIRIKCKNKGHGYFHQEANSHLQGSGCPICAESKGERVIRNLLLKNKINYQTEYKIPLQTRRFRYDFFLPDHNLLIEYHGEQHYRSVDFFGGECGFAKTKERDLLKKALAKRLKYKMLTIPYWELVNKDVAIFEKKLLYSLLKAQRTYPFISTPVREKWYDSRTNQETA